MKKPAHTQTPWTVDWQGRGQTLGIFAGNLHIATLDHLDGADIPNGEFIVKAVNCHEQLLAAAKAIVSMHVFHNEENPVLLELKAAIAKAETP